MMMQVADKQRNVLGLLTVLPGSQLQWKGTDNPALQVLLDKAQREGIAWEAHDGTTTVVANNNAAFAPALKEHLEAAGYRVSVRHPEVLERFSQLMAQFPDDEPEKQRLKSVFPDMSYLQQSAILEALEADDAQ